jgi:type VI secretion system protein
MSLKLRVISDHYKALGKRSSRLFGVTGGRIGRSQDNDWVLPDSDRYVSSHHCKVTFSAGDWVLEDTSTNGVFINGSDTPAAIEGPYVLQDGDRLRLGDYELLVSIDGHNDFSADASGQIPTPARVRKAPAAGEDLGEELDLTDLLSDSAISAPAKKAAPRVPEKPAAAPVAAKLAHNGFASLLQGVDESDPQRTVAHGKNEDWQMQTRPYDRKTMTALTSPMSAARTEKSSAPAKRSLETGTQSSGIEALCRGAGIDSAALPADSQAALLTLAGQMLREVVLGLMESLKTRSELKGRLRLRQTAIQPGESNNPLKFSASVEEAVLKLLDPHGSRYLGPVEAIRESFTDLRTHQGALAGAMQAAVDELMSRIEPGELQERFDRGLKRGPLLGATNKMKYWDLYVEFYQTLNQRNEEGLPTLVAEEIVRHYSEKAAKRK